MFFKKPKNRDKYNVHVDLAKKKRKKREPITPVFGMNRTRRKNVEFLMQVFRTLGNCFGAVFALLALYLTYKIYVSTVLGG